MHFDYLLTLGTSDRRERRAETYSTFVRVNSKCMGGGRQSGGAIFAIFLPLNVNWKVQEEGA